MCFCKAQQSPWGPLEVSRAPCELWKRPAKALGISGRQQGLLLDFGESWIKLRHAVETVEPMAGFGKA